MSVAYRRTICLGQIQIPTSLYTVIQDNGVHFNQLHKDTKERIQSVKTCPSCDGEVKPEDIIRGYQYTKDRYVIISDDELEECKMEKDKKIQIMYFSDFADIDPIYYDKPYYAQPDVSGEKAFELLRISMMENHKMAIVQTILVSKDTLAPLIPTQNGMLMRTLYYVDDVKEAPTYHKAQVVPEELSAFKQLENSMSRHFEHTQHHDEYRIRIQEKVDAKVAAQEIVVAGEPEPPLPVMEALRKSILEAKKSGDTRKKPKEGTENTSTSDAGEKPHRGRK